MQGYELHAANEKIIKPIFSQCVQTSNVPTIGKVNDDMA